MTADEPAIDLATAPVVLVTGGGQGIGRTFCLDLAVRGYRVIVTDINLDRARAVADEISAKGAAAAAIRLDVADPGSCRDAAEGLGSMTSRLHGLVNNAAMFSTLQMRPFWDIPVEEWTQVVTVNLTGVWLATKAFLPYLRNSSGSRIVNIAASAVFFGRENYAHYVSSKAGVIGLSRCMARELGGEGIAVNAITPGSIDTGIPRPSVTPEQRRAITASQLLHHPLTPEDVTGALAFLLSGDSASITGQIINVDGGAVTR